MDTSSLIAVGGTLGGVAIAGLFQYLLTSRQRRYQLEDQRNNRKYEEEDEKHCRAEKVLMARLEPIEKVLVYVKNEMVYAESFISDEKSYIPAEEIETQRGEVEKLIGIAHVNISLFSNLKAKEYWDIVNSNYWAVRGGNEEEINNPKADNAYRELCKIIDQIKIELQY